MTIEALNFDAARNLGINYIPCCKIVLMFYNVLKYDFVLRYKK